MKKPGIMIYFDVLDPIKTLDAPDAGRLLVAMLEYGANGTLPEFQGALALAWGFIRPKLDRDTDAYTSSVLHKRHAVFCRERKRRGLEAVDYEDWLVLSDDERKRMVSLDHNSYPTAPTTSSSTTDTSLSISAAATATVSTTDNDYVATIPAEEQRLEVRYGNIGRGLVNLSDYQVDLLLDKLGIDMYDYYVSKLADHIEKYGPVSKGHYATILRWWTQDTAI